MTGQSSLFAQEIDEVAQVLARQKEIEWPKIRLIAEKLRAKIHRTQLRSRVEARIIQRFLSAS